MVAVSRKLGDDCISTVKRHHTGLRWPYIDVASTRDRDSIIKTHELHLKRASFVPAGLIVIPMQKQTVDMDRNVLGPLGCMSASIT